MVRAYHITHVGKIPKRLEVADADKRLPFFSLDLRDLFGERLTDIHIALPRTGVVEAAGADDFHSVTFIVLIAEKIHRDL